MVSTSPALSVNPSSLSFAYQIGSTTPAAQPVSVSGTAGLNFTATPATNAGGAWLVATPGGTTPAPVSVSISPSGLTPNTYTGTVTMSAPGATSVLVSVTLVVTGPPTITASPTSLNFNYQLAGTAPAAQGISITTGTTALAFTAAATTTSGGSWLSVTSSGTTPGSVAVSVNIAKLNPATYNGSITITVSGASNSPLAIPVTLTVTPSTATINALPANINYSMVAGGANPASQTTNISSTAPLNFSITIVNGAWLSVTSSSLSTPSTLTATVNGSNLAAGSYTATITLTSPLAINSPMVIPVALIVSPKPTFAITPSTLTFTTPAGSTPATQSINISGTSPLPFTLTSSSPNWLSVSAASGTTPSNLVVSVNPNGMAVGSYLGTITITSSAAGNSPVNIPVHLNIVTPLVVPPTITSVVNAASYETTGFSPGAIVSIFGSLLGPQTQTSFTLNTQGTIDPTLGGTTVTVGGIAAIPLMVQNSQVNVILPFNLGTSGQASVQVQYNNQTSAGFNIPLETSDVQIFTANASGTGQGSILNQDFSINSQNNPAAPGSFISVYGTGGGAVSPAVTAGGVAGDTLSWITLPYSATINGETAIVQYAGTAPGLVNGVYQFNVQIPADIPAGAATIVLTVGNSTSQPNVTVFVN